MDGLTDEITIEPTISMIFVKQVQLFFSGKDAPAAFGSALQIFREQEMIMMPMVMRMLPWGFTLKTVTKSNFSEIIHFSLIEFIQMNATQINPNQKSQMLFLIKQALHMRKCTNANSAA